MTTGAAVVSRQTTVRASSGEVGGGGARRPARRYPALGICTGGGALLGLVVAVAQNRSPSLALVAAVLAGVTYVALLEPLVALALLLIVAWSNLTNAVGHQGGLSVYFVALAIGVASLIIAVRRTRANPFPHSPMYLLLFVAMAATGLSLIASNYPVASLATPTQRIKDIAFFFVALGLLHVTKRWGTALRVIVVTVAVLGGLSLIQQYVLHNSTTFHGLETLPHNLGFGTATVRHAGPEGDPNFWGRDLVLATGPALALFSISLRQGRRRSAALWLVAVLALLGGEYLTQSRGDLLAMFGLLILWVVILGWRHRRLLLLLPVAVVAIIFVVPGLSTRLGTLSQLSSASAPTTDSSLVGRIQAQQVGLAEFRSSPLSGVGFGNFVALEPRFLGQAGIVDTGKVLEPHDLYLEILAEGGLLGGAAWVLLYGGAMVLSLRATLIARRLRAESEQLLALGCFVSLVGWGTASIVLHLNYFESLLAIMAVVTAIDAHVRRRARNELIGDGDLVPARPRWIQEGAGRLAVRTGVMTLGVALILGIALLLPLYKTTYQATATASVRPRAAPKSTSNAYTWVTVSRASLLPTLAGVAANHRFVNEAADDIRLSRSQAAGLSVSGSGDASNAVLRIRVEAEHPDVAAAMAKQTLERGRSYLNENLLSIYEVQSLSPGSVRTQQSLRISLLATLAVVGISATVLGRSVTRNLLRRLT